MTEAELVDGEGGWREPGGEGWWVLNAKDARWQSNEMGWYCGFETKAAPFREFALNLNFLGDGQPMAMYHHEPHQEGFLVLRGEALLIVEGEEHPLRQCDYVHCPPDVPHVIVGRGDGALVLAVGSRTGGGGASYPVDEAAMRHGAGVESETSSPREAYERFGPLVSSPYPGGLLEE